jgi:hypothetical protein
VQKRLTERAVLRQTRRNRRIKRNVAFKFRNHRQKRFDNRKQSKIPPSILANKQLELRVINELCKLYPITHIYIERLSKSNSLGFTVAAQGQNHLIRELSSKHSVTLVEGWETQATRIMLNLPKSENKGEQSAAAHVSDGIALSARHFVRYATRTTGCQTGHHWKGLVEITPFPFGIISRLSSRPRKMHELTVQKGGVRDSYGGFRSTHSFRNGDYVEYRTKRSNFRGYISANDLYQFHPIKKRLKQGITDRTGRLIRYSSNLIVNLHSGLTSFSCTTKI